MNMFEIGEYVIYKNGDNCEFGIIKEQLSSKPEKYLVWYHIGDTTAVTDAEFLFKLINGSSILEIIKRHS